MLEENVDDPMSMTEVGAYEAIQSIRDRDSDDPSPPMMVFKNEADLDATAGGSSSINHQDHLYVQRPKSIKCLQCRRVSVSNKNIFSKRI